MMQALEKWTEGGNQIPAEVASEIASLLSHPEFYTGKGSRDFLFDIAYFLGEYLDSNCRTILVEAVVNSYPKYANGVLCLIALDLINEFSADNAVVEVLRPLGLVCSGIGLELLVDTIYDMWRFRLSDEGARDKCVALMNEIHRLQSDPRILSATTHYLQEMRVFPGADHGQFQGNPGTDHDWGPLRWAVGSTSPRR